MCLSRDALVVEVAFETEGLLEFQTASEAYDSLGKVGAGLLFPRTRESVENVQQSLHVLSGSSLSKNQLYIDAAFCSYWRERYAFESGPVYIWADSSPQAGANWLLSMVLSIRADVLQETAKAARYLASSAGSIASEAEMEEDFDACLRRRSDAGRTISSNMVVHSQIPVALGSGASGVEHTLRCMVHKCFVETSSASACRRFFRRTRGCCVDVGVEFSLSDANGVDAMDLMPAWTRAAVEDEEDDPEDMLGPNGEQFLMPLSILSAGLVHIVNNIQKDVDSNLPGWSAWLPGYKAIAYLLHKVLLPTSTKGSHKLSRMPRRPILMPLRDNSWVLARKSTPGPPWIDRAPPGRQFALKISPGDKF